MSCCTRRCDDPDCQVCTTVERGFPPAEPFKRPEQKGRPGRPRKDRKPKVTVDGDQTNLIS